MKFTKLFYAGLLVLPWLTIPFFGRNAFKKYYPSALLICIFTKILDAYGERKKWWRFYKGIPPLDSMFFFNWGPYFVSSLWVLKMTYGKFYLYVMSNILLHIVFIYFGGVKFVSRFKIFTLMNLTKFQYLIIDFVRALLLYGFQKIIDLIRPGNKNKKLRSYG